MPSRSRIEIYAEILECCRIEATTSLIIQKCNLKYPLFKECVEFLKSKSLIQETNQGERKIFMNTEKGNEALRNYAQYYLQLFRKPLKPITELRTKTIKT